MNCPKCNASLKDGAQFCHVCGFNMSGATQNPQPQQQQPQQQNPFQNFNQANAQAAASNIFSRASNIMFKPKTEWQAIELETPNTSSILFGYVIPLALIPAIFSILGYGLIGVSWGWGFKFTSWSWGIEVGLTSFITSIASVYLTAFIIDALAPSFKTQKNFGKAMQLVAYSLTPMWVAGIFNFFPAVAFIAFLGGIYGLYLLYVGFEYTMKPAKESQMGYFLATIGILIVINIVFSLVLGAILMSAFAVGPSFNYGY
jgi:hypothetical protein